MRTGTGIFLITADAILRFAIPAGSLHGLNVARRWSTTSSITSIRCSEALIGQDDWIRCRARRPQQGIRALTM
jgi:hypothetical protein